jgi:hypothetical protein
VAAGDTCSKPVDFEQGEKPEALPWVGARLFLAVSHPPHGQGGHHNHGSQRNKVHRASGIVLKGEHERGHGGDKARGDIELHKSSGCWLTLMYEQ